MVSGLRINFVINLKKLMVVNSQERHGSIPEGGGEMRALKGAFSKEK